VISPRHIWCWVCKLSLGSIALAAGLLALWGLKWLERQIPRDRYATLVLTLGPDRPTEEEVCGSIRAAGLRVIMEGVTYDAVGGRRELHCDVRWRARSDEVLHPAVVKDLSRLAGVCTLRWNPQGSPTGV